MALQDGDSGMGCTFGLRFDGCEIKEITEASGIKMEQDVVQLKQNTADGKFVTKNMPGKQKSGEVTVKRAVTNDNSFDRWITDCRFGKMTDARKSGEIIIYDYTGLPLKRYRMRNAWPKSLEVSQLQAGGTTVLTESLVITYEEMTVE